jgi:hypothetical protein
MNDGALHKAVLDEQLAVSDLEATIASAGGLVHRVDQTAERMVAFFSGDEETAQACAKLLAERGSAQVGRTSEEELSSFPE